MPNVVGEDYVAAQRQLYALGIDDIPASCHPSDATVPHNVLTQWPTPGTPVNVKNPTGPQATLIVSCTYAPPAAPTTTSPPTTEPPPPPVAPPPTEPGSP